MDKLSQLNQEQYIDLYYGDASHFSLVPNVPYAWQAEGEPILLPAIRGKSVSVFGLMNTLGNLVFDIFETTINSEKMIVFFDKFVENITKKQLWFWITLRFIPVRNSKKKSKNGKS